MGQKRTRTRSTTRSAPITGAPEGRARRTTPGTTPWWYWLAPIPLAGVLAWLGLISTHSIRYEELAESVRNVFWFDERLVYDGVYSNVGWYGTLLAAYRLFGFSLYTAKVVRLAIHVAGLFALAAVLRRGLRAGPALVPLVVAGLSPAVLYFGTLQTSFGLDLPYAAICLWLLLATRPASPGAWSVAAAAGCGVVAMIAAMSYPVFVLYVPSLALVAVWHARSSQAEADATARAGRLVAAGLAGAALPLAAVFLWVRTPEILWHDPATGAGLFRGGGQLGFDPATIARALGLVAGDLFTRGASYYYDVTRPDFSGAIGLIGCLGVVAWFVLLAARRRVAPLVAIAIGLLVLLGLGVPALTVDGEPGLRRSTPVLAAFFAMYAFAWREARGGAGGARLRTAALVACLLVPVAHVTHVPSLAADLARANPFQDYQWFSVAPTPAASLDRLRAQIEAGQRLGCPRDAAGQVVPCRLQEIYAALAGWYRWNEGRDRPIEAFDWRTGDPIPLTTEIWTSGYYPTCTRPEACRQEMERIQAELARGGAAAGSSPPR
ncbi:MAG: hypothetical protein R2752_05630 [Vicinamibacterales bacterium]